MAEVPGEYLPVMSLEFQKDAAFEHVAKIAGFHRIQASPGYREAAHYVFSTMNRLGVDAEILSFPANQSARWWSQASFKEWACDDAELTLLEDGKRERLCSFQESKMSLIQRSAPAKPGGFETTIVRVENAAEPASYESLDVSGKIVLSRGDAQAIAKVAVDRFGATGIVLDNMNEFPPVRDRFEIPDARQYTSFWPGKTEEFRAFGFVLSPRQGEALRRRFTAEKRELKAFARVDTRFYDGAIEDVTAAIPGETAGEVVAIAHLCHPQESANDNASGSGTLMETARTLAALIREGRLKRPLRTIRFLWVPEMTGSYAYLASNESKIGKTVAAINLDMVGGNQDLCKGPFLVERPPKALAGFGGDLAESILRALAREAGNLAGTASYATFKWAVTPFSGGSDHYIWADPTVGVTCPMLIQWPDRYYHTSQDTIDKVDPRMLRLAGVLTAAYLYFAASAGPKEAALLAGDMASHFPAEAEDALAEVMKTAGEALSSARTPKSRAEAVSKARRTVERRAGFLGERKALDIGSLSKLAGDSACLAGAQAKAQEYVARTAAFFKEKGLADLAAAADYDGPASLPPAWESRSCEVEEKAGAMVPERVYRGPLSSRGVELSVELAERMEAFGKKHRAAARLLTYLQYWADGRRTLSEIADLVEGETGQRDIEMMVEHVDLMVKCGSFRLK